jgi:CRP-like cAMP-binding protein
LTLDPKESACRFLNHYPAQSVRCFGQRDLDDEDAALAGHIADDDISAMRSHGFPGDRELLQIMQCTACNALHDVRARCCRWLLQTQDRVGSKEFLLKHEFLAIMLGVHRPTVTLVMGRLQRSGLISSKYGRIRVLKRKGLEDASCECYEVIRTHFERLGL